MIENDPDGDGAHVHRFYRTIKGHQATHADFLSDEAAGSPPPRDVDKVRYWRGFSAFATLAQARAIAQKNRRQGVAIAEMTIPSNGSITYERWGRNPGHHTLWGNPNDCLQRITSVYPVWPSDEEQSNDDSF